MYCIILFTVCFRLPRALVVYKNVAFHKASYTALLQSKWLSTFKINLKPYDNF